MAKSYRNERLDGDAKHSKRRQGMSSAITVTALSDAEIKRQAQGKTGTLRDDRYPGVRFRFLTDRGKGSWFLISGDKWEKVAGYPQLSCKKFLEVLPELQA